ncbi:MAG TPA: hypothetical protein VF988_02385 [Verrucomicrobiae bacterium]
MIARFRNRALLQAAGAIGLTLMVPHWLSRFMHRGHYQRADGIAVAMIVCYFMAWVMWGLVALNVSKAKGYGNELVTPKVIILYSLSLFVPITPILFVLYAVFGLKSRFKPSKKAPGALVAAEDGN